MPSKNNNVKYFVMCHTSFCFDSKNWDQIENNALKFKVNDRVRTANYKNAFSKGCTKNW